MLTEIQYKTFDELLDSVRLDLKTFDLEGMIDSQQLIKVAMRINYELGLKINPSRSKALEVVNGKAKLPPDFYVLNFAMIMEDTSFYKEPENTKSYAEGLSEGILQGIYLNQQYFLQHNVSSFTQTVNIAPGSNVITHNLDTKNYVVEAYDTSGSMLTFQIHTVNSNQINIVSSASTTLTNIKLVIIGAPDNPSTTLSTPLNAGGCPAEMVNDPLLHIPKVMYVTNNKLLQSRRLAQLRIEKSKSVSPDCVNLQSKAYASAYIKNGFLVTNFDEGLIYINYQSLMEDDFGNLLVLDHPFANEFYEYALKQRIFENLLMAGESTVSNYMQIIEQRLRNARNNAMSYINTPDFREMEKNWQMNRKALYNKYYDMFKSII